MTDLKCEQVDFDRGELHVNRLKEGTESTHPMTGRELRELRRHRRESPSSSRFVFVSERGAPLSAEGFNRMVKCAGFAADLGIKVHFVSKLTFTRRIDAYPSTQRQQQVGALSP